MEPFRFFNEKETLPALHEIHIQKRGNFYDFRVPVPVETTSSIKKIETRRCSFGLTNVVLSMDYFQNAYKKTKVEGYLNFDPTDRAKMIVGLIEEKMRETLLNKKIDNMLFSKNMLSNNYNSAIKDGTFKVSCGPETTVIFNARREILYPVDFGSLQAGMEVDLTIEPNFIWIMKKENNDIAIGIRWDVRQIRLLSNVEYTVVLRLCDKVHEVPDGNDADVDADNEITKVTNQKLSVKEPVKVAMACLYSDDDDQVEIPKGKKKAKKVAEIQKAKKKKEELVKLAMAALYSDNDDVQEEIARDSKNPKKVSDVSKVSKIEKTKKNKEPVKLAMATLYSDDDDVSEIATKDHKKAKKAKKAKMVEKDENDESNGTRLQKLLVDPNRKFDLTRPLVTLDDELVRLNHSSPLDKKIETDQLEKGPVELPMALLYSDDDEDKVTENLVQIEGKDKKVKREKKDPIENKTDKAKKIKKTKKDKTRVEPILTSRSPDGEKEGENQFNVEKVETLRKKNEDVTIPPIPKPKDKIKSPQKEAKETKENKKNKENKEITNIDKGTSNV